MKVADLHIMVILHLYFRSIHGIAVQAVHLLSGSSDFIQLYNYTTCIHFVTTCGCRGGMPGQSPQN